MSSASKTNTNCLIRVGQTTHTAGNTQHVVVGSIHTNLGSVYASNSGIGQDQLKRGVVNTGEVACAGRLVLLRAKGEGEAVNTCVGGTGMCLVGLDDVEVGALTLGEAVLAVKLELGCDHRVLTPTMHVKGRLGKDERTGIRESGTSSTGNI